MIKRKQTAFEMTGTFYQPEIGKGFIWLVLTFIYNLAPFNKGMYLGFCTDCCSVVRVRPLFQCSKCKKVYKNIANILLFIMNALKCRTLAEFHECMSAS